ncbi:hypothetical protein Dimus_009597 [Dionaea muscipula]
MSWDNVRRWILKVARGKTAAAERRKGVLVAVVYEIWKERNQRSVIPILLSFQWRVLTCLDGASVSALEKLHRHYCCWMSSDPDCIEPSVSSFWLIVLRLDGLAAVGLMSGGKTLLLLWNAG